MVFTTKLNKKKIHQVKIILCAFYKKKLGVPRQFIFINIRAANHLSQLANIRAANHFQMLSTSGDMIINLLVPTVFFC